MSKLARTDIDVRISSHKSKQNKLLVMIKFYDGVELLLDKYIKAEITGDRLYFKSYSEKVSGSVKLNESYANLSICKNANALKEFEGEYKTLHFDSDNDLYYVDKNDATSISRAYGNYNGPKYNYRSHKGSIAPKKEEKKQVVDVDTKVIDTKTPVVENLIKALFDFQIYVEGMDSAVKLLDELNNKYK